MPTTSSFFSKGAFTPVTMFWTSDRASPWRARTLRSSPAREMTTWVPSTFALSPGGRGWTSFPFGPSAVTRPSTPCTFPPCGITMGSLPMRDIVRPSPHVGEDFPAHTLLPRVAIGEDAPRRRQKRHTHAAEDGRDPVAGHVDAPARRGHAHDSGDHLLVPRAVLEVHAQRPLLGVLQQPEILDEPFVLQELGDPQLELRGGDVDLLLLGAARGAGTRPHVRDPVAPHRASQLAFTMSGPPPPHAWSREHRPHLSNLPGLPPR